MKRALLICLSLVLALVGWSTVGAEDGFYVIGGGGKSASVPKTGQTTSYGTRDDGALKKGVAWPTPRFTDNGNGTVTDNLTGLIWMKNTSSYDSDIWTNALGTCNSLASPTPHLGLTDGSKAGDWRLPNIWELQSLVDYERIGPALPAGHPLKNVQSTAGGPFSYYWSSTTNWAFARGLFAWVVNFHMGSGDPNEKINLGYVWCVRGGQ